MYGSETKRDMIRNDNIREAVRVTPIIENIVENRLRWFGNLERRPIDYVVRRVDPIDDDHITRDRGRPIKTIRQTIRKYGLP